jgi:hypothetical protein
MALHPKCQARDPSLKPLPSNLKPEKADCKFHLPKRKLNARNGKSIFNHRRCPSLMCLRYLTLNLIAEIQVTIPENKITALYQLFSGNK